MSRKASTTGSKSWTPSTLSAENNDTITEQFHRQLTNNDLKSAIITAFSLPVNDEYIYHATASVSLSQVQAAIDAGRSNGLHSWYNNLNEHSLQQYPPTQDIQSYITLFDPSKSPANSLKSFKSNAKKNSIRSTVAEHLLEKRYLDSSIVLPKRKTRHSNPYLDFWAWSCHSLEYTGPNRETNQIKMSHHILPVFMHHFGCVCPSYESLALIQYLATLSTNNPSTQNPSTPSNPPQTTSQKSTRPPRTILDIGSGNGYWTYLLRTQHNLSVLAIDNGQSTWRTTWIPDTTNADGLSFLKTRQNGIDDLLLLVYPIVGGDFTRKVLDAFQGDVICVVGTQNGNGYTAFQDGDVDVWMDRYKKEEWKLVARLALPSFAGKDDAIFAFRRVGR